MAIGALLDRSPRGWVTDGGLETDLVFHHGVDLPEFAAYPLLASKRGRGLLRDYFLGYAAVARAVGAGLLLETPTWRANPDWGKRLGDGPAELRRANREAVASLRRLREKALADMSHVLIVGMVGPRGDGYAAADATPEEALAYHRPQTEALAEAGADLITGYTLSSAAEAIGIVWAARGAGVAAAISFTVETDGRLPDGSTLGTAIAEVESAAPADHYLVNCAHPAHVALALNSLTGPQRALVRGVRGNASRQSHAELDEAEALDEGDVISFGASTRALGEALPRLDIRGGCCGTDARHVAEIWNPRTPPASHGPAAP